MTPGMVGSMRVGELWFLPKKFEVDGRIYRWLGVIAFKRRLMRLVRTNPTANDFHKLGGHSLSHLRAFDVTSRRSELIHLVGLAMGVVFMSLGAIALSLMIAGLAAFVLKFHCFALQRFNRARIYRVLQRARNQNHITHGELAGPL